MTKALIVALAIAVLTSLGLGFALKRYITIVGERDVTIAAQKAAIAAAETTRKDNEAALAMRDAEVAAYRNTVNQYRTQLKTLEAQYAEVKEWSNKRVPDHIIKLMCQLTDSHRTTCLPFRVTPARESHTRVGRND